MLKKRWKINAPENDFLTDSLAESLNISKVLAALLIMRDVKNFQQAKNFFRPTIESLHNPFLMTGMEKATYRIIQALTDNEPIVIYGDYDVDGTCSTALMYMFLKELDANVDFYIPKRLTEGYGISKAGLELVNAMGASLVVSVDCGITAVDEVEYAKKLGLDIIICDHHQPKDRLPDAYAVLDPLQPGCNYPYKYLSGAGVAFKLAQGIAERIGKRELPMQYLDLVALASAADIVPLVEENRILVKEGLKQINEDARPGIKALIKKSNIEPGNLNSGQIVFTLAPRINAVGRLGDAQHAVELLVTRDEQTAMRLAQMLEVENYTRRKIDEDTYLNAVGLVEDSLDLTNELAIILHQESWHPGVIGIVASRLVEKYYRPTIMLTTVDGIAKGSARSISNFNIYEALRKCEEFLLHFGGHQAAAGLALDVERLHEFKQKFNQIVKETLRENDLFPEIYIDSKLKFSEITPKFLRIIEMFSPFGPGNMRPVFVAENVEVSGFPRVVGSSHLVINLKQNGSERVFDCIGFNMGNYCDLIGRKNTPLDIVFTIDKTSRDGRTYPQLRLKDIAIKQNIQELV